MVAYFSQAIVGFSYDGVENPAEFVLNIASGKALVNDAPFSRSAEELEAIYNSLTPQGPFEVPVRPSPTASATHERMHATTKLTQLKMLIYRTALSIIRDTEALQAEFLKCVIVGILIAVIFFGQAKTSTPLFVDGVPKAEVNNISSLLFFGMMYTSIATAEAVPFICSRYIIFRREVASHTYAVSPYWVSQCITNLPFMAIFHLIFVVVFYFPCGFPLDFDYFMYLYIGLYLNMIISFYAAMILAALTNGNKELSLALFPLIFIVLSSFAGFSVPIQNLPELWYWACYVSYLRWVFQGAMVNQWESFETDDSPNAVNGNGDVLALYSFEGFNKYDTFWILSIYISAAAIVLYILLRPPKNELKWSKEMEDFGSENDDVEASNNNIYSSIEPPKSLAESLRESLLGDSVSVSVYTSAPTADDANITEVQQFTDALNMESSAAHCASYQLDFYDLSYSIFLSGKSQSWFNLNTSSLTNRSIELLEEEVSALHDTKSDHSSLALLNRKQILSSVFGSVKPGELCALMGEAPTLTSTSLHILSHPYFL